jgi:TorA maturation chaperone TorD
MTQVAPVQFVSPEEAARANFYGLLARLFYAPPDAALLEALAASEDIEAEDGDLGLAWRDLVQAAAGADAEAVREEHETQFVGTGKAPVTLYAAAYLMRYSNDAPLVGLREHLAALGVARRSNVHEPEDHIAALCEVMRFLIAEQRPVAQQKAFFERWILPTSKPLCNAIEKAEGIRFYLPVARFAAKYFSLEQSAFEML